MDLKHSWHGLQAAAEVWVITLLGALPLAALHWLASHVAEG
jgi:hypothetical protein